MNQYTRGPSNGRRNGRFQGEGEHEIPNAVEGRNHSTRLELVGRLPLPTNPRPLVGLPSSPRPLGARIAALQSSYSSNQSNSQDRQMNVSNEHGGFGRSLMNPPVDRSRPGPLKPSFPYLDRKISHQEEQDDLGMYNDSKLPPLPQPRYNRPRDFEVDRSPVMPIVDAVSMVNSSRSTDIGEISVPVVNSNTTLTPLTPMPRPRVNTAPPPPSGHGAPPQSSPIAPSTPEDPPDTRHCSYASSHVIPSTWESVGSASMYEEEDEDQYRPIPNENDEHKGLVRQASLGRKSKPTITQIRTPTRVDTIKQTSLHTHSDPPSPLRDESPVTGQRTAAPTPYSSKELMAFKFPPPEPFENTRQETEDSSNLGINSVNHSRVLPLYSQSFKPLNSARSGNIPGRMKGRKAPPPGLNINAVREAEARGSLTSLPDLIRRATKLAAALESGKGRDGRNRGSYTASYFTDSSSNRRADSLSDMLGSFPPPDPGSRYGRCGSKLTLWPLASDFIKKDISSDGGSLEPKPSKRRRLCGVPLWAFILFVILVLLAITTAIIVPLQMVTISRSQQNHKTTSSEGETQQKCQETKCDNGGEVISLKDFCGCICVKGYGGANCTELDNSCVTMDLDGVKNATVGSAVKRLLNISQPKYNVHLNGTRVLSTLWAQDVNCTAQNALMTFGGETGPNESTTTISSTTIPPIITPPPATKRFRRDTSDLEYDTHPTVTLNDDALDFSRVAVLYLVQDKGLGIATTAYRLLQAEFSRGVDTGSVQLGNNISIDLGKKVLNLPGESSVGKTNT